MYYIMYHHYYFKLHTTSQYCILHRVLRISMERKGMVKEEDDTFRRIERFHGHMSRSLTLPSNVAKDAIDAQCTNGVLHVRIPKIEGEKETKVLIK